MALYGRAAIHACSLARMGRSPAMCAGTRAAGDPSIAAAVPRVDFDDLRTNVGVGERRMLPHELPQGLACERKSVDPRFQAMNFPLHLLVRIQRRVARRLRCDDGGLVGALLN